MIGRRGIIRGVLLLVTGVTISACKKAERCGHCGMKIDPSSAWTSELIRDGGAVVRFDTPRCALTAWKTGKVPAASVRVQEYYERRWRDGGEVRFVTGGDVVGPMGADFVPVDPARVTKFIQDHGADRALRLDEITTQVLGAQSTAP